MGDVRCARKRARHIGGVRGDGKQYCRSGGHNGTIATVGPQCGARSVTAVPGRYRRSEMGQMSIELHAYGQKTLREEESSSDGRQALPNGGTTTYALLFEGHAMPAAESGRRGSRQSGALDDATAASAISRERERDDVHIGLSWHYACVGRASAATRRQDHSIQGGFDGSAGVTSTRQTIGQCMTHIGIGDRGTELCGRVIARHCEVRWKRGRSLWRKAAQRVDGNSPQWTARLGTAHRAREHPGGFFMRTRV